jgi:hypothetical protein
VVGRHATAAGWTSRTASRCGGTQAQTSTTVSGLEGATKNDLPDRVRRLDVDGYMIATREILQLAAWLRRAVQATFGDG